MIEDGGDPAFQSWRDLVRNPLEWWDNREDKLKGSVSASPGILLIFVTDYSADV